MLKTREEEANVLPRTSLKWSRSQEGGYELMAERSGKINASIFLGPKKRIFVESNQNVRLKRNETIGGKSSLISAQVKNGQTRRSV